MYGARPLKRVIQQRVQNELANAMLEGAMEGEVGLLLPQVAWMVASECRGFPKRLM